MPKTIDDLVWILQIGDKECEMHVDATGVQDISNALYPAAQAIVVLLRWSNEVVVQEVARGST